MRDDEVRSNTATCAICNLHMRDCQACKFLPYKAEERHPVMEDVRVCYDTDPTKQFVVADVQDFPHTLPYGIILYYITDRTIPSPLPHRMNEMCAELEGCGTDTDLYDYARGG